VNFDRTCQVIHPISNREKGIRNIPRVRAQVSHQYDPGSKPGVDVIKYVEFLFGSHSCFEGFAPGSSLFLQPQKPTFLNLNQIPHSRPTGFSFDLF